MRLPAVVLRLLGTTAFLVATTGCVKTVQVALPPAPAVTLDTAQVAVVAADKKCREIADALVSELRLHAGIEVTPTATVRLQVFDCDETVRPEIDIQQRVDGERGTTFSRQRVTVTGAAHAVVAVVADDAALAHLIGSGRRAAFGDWGDGDVFALRRSVQRSLTDAVVGDLAEQIRPMPRLVERRIWPNASEGSARQLHTLAVRAELEGDLPRAHELADAAHHAAPSRQSQAYVEELGRRMRVGSAN